MNIKYVHTNIIAKDWRRLAQFYIDVFDCKAQYPERDLSGEWIDKMTGIKDVNIRGIHLSLPGYKEGPTLEIFEYNPENTEESNFKLNKQGLGHIAFHVDDVERVVDKLIEHGGKKLGEIIRKDYSELGMLTAVYARDPEGNIVEVQNWS